MRWFLKKIKQPSTCAGIAAIFTAVSQAGSWSAAVPLILAGLGSVLADA